MDRKQPRPKVLIIRPAALGDTLMLMPAVAALAGSVQIVVVGREPGISFLKPYVEQVIDYERSGWHGLYPEDFDPSHAPSIPDVDGAVAFLGDPDGVAGPNLKTLLPGAPVRLFPPFPPKGEKSHVALYLAQCLQGAGLPLDPEKSISEAVSRPLLRGDKRLKRQNSVVLHPGSGSQRKNHSPQFWFRLEAALRRGPFRSGAGFLWLLGPAEEEVYPVFKENVSRGRTDILFAPEKEKLASVLREAAFYIGHDSGVTHLAAMVGTPTVALFKDSAAAQWRPLGPDVRVIERGEGDPQLLEEIMTRAQNLPLSGSLP